MAQVIYVEHFYNDSNIGIRALLKYIQTIHIKEKSTLGSPPSPYVYCANFSHCLGRGDPCHQFHCVPPYLLNVNLHLQLCFSVNITYDFQDQLS